MKSARNRPSRPSTNGVPLPVSFLRTQSKKHSNKQDKKKVVVGARSRKISEVAANVARKSERKARVEIKEKKEARVIPRVQEIKKAAAPLTTFKRTLAPGLIRLEKHMAQTGLSSRREAKDLIRAGLVMVNKTVVREAGHGIDPTTDKVTLKTHAIPNHETIILFKPRGIETTATNEKSEDIVKRYPKFAHLSPVGRLDKNSDGLILMSNDGTLTKYFTGKNSHLEKEYLVRVREAVLPEHLARMARGIKLDNIMTLPTQTVRHDRNSFTIILREGRKHQIRRMCDSCQLTVESLTRIRIGHMSIGKMTPGNFKVLTDRDIEMMKQS